MLVMTRLSIRIHTAMHSPATGSIMACSCSAFIAPLLTVNCTYKYMAVKRAAAIFVPTSWMPPFVGMDAEQWLGRTPPYLSYRAAVNLIVADAAFGQQNPQLADAGVGD